MQSLTAEGWKSRLGIRSYLESYVDFQDTITACADFVLVTISYMLKELGEIVAEPSLELLYCCDTSSPATALEFPRTALDSILQLSDTK